MAPFVSTNTRTIMTLKEFFKDNSLSKKDVTFKKSKSCYADSDVTMDYIKLSKPVDGFLHVIISKNAKEAVQDGDLKYQELEMTFDAEYGWKAQLPDSSESFEVDEEGLF